MKRIYIIFSLFFLFTQINTKEKFRKPIIKKNKIEKLKLKNNLNLLKNKLFRQAVNTNLDPSFGINGLVNTDLAEEIDTSSRDIVFSSALQSDGKLVTGGISTPDHNFVNFALARYTNTGNLDQTFGTNGVVSTDVAALLGQAPNTSYSLLFGIAIQTDGKIIAGGTVGTQTSTYNSVLVRYNTDGTVDDTFGTNGAVVTDMGAIVGLPNRQSIIRNIIIQPDNKILINGSIDINLALARYLSDGSLDPLFGTNGVVINTDLVASIPMNAVLQTDNKIVSGGEINGKFGIVRYTSSGSLDSSYGTNGLVITSFGPGIESVIANLGIYLDKVIAGGFSRDANNTVFFTMAKYNTDGTLDTSFGTNGKINTNLNNLEVTITKLAVQNDGKIVTGGTFFGSSNPNLNASTFVLTRLEVDGSLDTSFGTNGVADTNFGLIIFGQGLESIDHLYSLIINSAGNIYASGSTTALDSNLDFAIAKYNNNGSLNTNFGTIFGAKLGLVDTDFKKVLGITAGSENAINSIATQSNGNIIAGGYSDALDPNYDFALSIYSNDGTLQQFFPVDFSDFFNLNNAVFGTYDVATDIAIQKDDKIIMGGFTNGSGNIFSYALARLTADGALDLSFGINGLMATNFGIVQNKNHSNDNINSIALQSNEKIIAGGFTQPSDTSDISSFALARYTTSGILDTSFGSLSNGIQITNFGKVLNKPTSFDQILSIAIQTDDKIVAAGFTTVTNPFGDFALARYNPDGTLDQTFGNNGLVITKFSTSKITQNQINKILIQEDGKILAGGISSFNIPNFDTNNPRFNFALARYNIDGTLDQTFGNNGLVVTELTPGGNNSKSDDQLYSLVITKSNKIIAGGTSNAIDPNYDFALVQYNINGTIDRNFGDNGIVFTNFGSIVKLAGSTDVMKTMALQTDGKLLGAGNTNAGNPNYNSAIARYDIQSCILTNDIFINKLREKFQS